MSTVTTDITKVNGQLIKEVSKIIKDELTTAGLHLLELKKGLVMVKSGTFVTDSAIKIKEAYAKAAKEPNAPTTYRKYAMRWGRLVSVEKRNEIKEALSDVADINALNMAEIDLLLGGSTANRGGGRKPKEEVKEPKEEVKEPKEEVKEPKEEVKEPKEEVKEPSGAPEPQEDVKTPVISVRKAKESILSSLNNLLALDSDSIAFKVSKLSAAELSKLAEALKLLY